MRGLGKFLNKAKEITEEQRRGMRLEVIKKYGTQCSRSGCPDPVTSYDPLIIEKNHIYHERCAPADPNRIDITEISKKDLDL